jgi:hypothetical protein
MRIRLSALVCGVSLLSLSNATAEDHFDVLVMHGSTLVRVTGDGKGSTSEVTVREDPTPPAPEIEWQTPEVRADPIELVIQVFQAAPRPVYGWGFRHAHRSFVRNEERDHGLPRTVVRGRKNTDGHVRHGSHRPEPGAL